MSVQIRKFTPSLLDGDSLDRLYVERDGVLDRILDRVDSARAGRGISHVLVVGPRGSGKTHLISLVRHRLLRKHPTMHIAWLVEDPYGILSYHELLEQIVERTVPSISASGESTEHLEAVVRAVARKHGPVLVLAENFDEILEQIGDLDQQRLRGLVESEPCLQLVVTTTALSGDLSDQPAPFYGFFNQITLPPFDTEQSVEYLRKRAEVVGDQEFIEQLNAADSTMIERRVRSIEHLAGGQPRIWALLAEGLTIDQLDDLVHYLGANFDDITPYYQSQLRQLRAPIQRRIVLTMVREDRALSAKAIGELINVKAATVTKTLRDLHDKGWVQPVDSPLLKFVDARLTYYELSEPLLRLALELKDNSRHEINTILSFVKLWFDPTEIEQAQGNVYAQRAIHDRSGDDPTTTTRWMLDLPTANTPSLRMLGQLFDAIDALGAGQGTQAFELPNVVRRAVEARLLDDRPESIAQLLLDLSRAAAAQAGYYPTEEVGEWLDRHRQLHGSLSGARTRSVELLVDWLARNWQFEAAELAVEQLDPDAPDTLNSRNNLANSYWTAGRTSVETLGDKHPDTLTSRINLATSYGAAGRTTEAIALHEQVLDDRIETLGDKHPDTLNSRNNVATSYWAAGRTTEAIGAPPKPSPSKNKSSPTASKSSATNTPTPSPPARCWLTGEMRLTVRN